MEFTQVRMLQMICGKTLNDGVKCKLILKRLVLNGFLRSQRLR